MDQTETWAQYLTAIRGNDLDKDVARRAGVSASTISRWQSGTHFPSPQQVIALARAYKESPLSALVAAGYLSANELEAYAEPRSVLIAAFTDLELAREIVRRIEAGEATNVLTDPVDAEITAPVTELRPRNVPTSRDTIDHVEAPDLEHLDYAASRGTRKADEVPWAE